MPRVCPSRERSRESQLAICWEPRVSGATAVRPEKSACRGETASGADNQQERPGVESNGSAPGILRGHTPATSLYEVKIWSEPHGDVRRTRAKFLVG